MPETWKEHCPINEDEHPVRRQAWHAGWIYRMEHSARIKGEEARRIARRMLDDYKPSMLSIWMQGYNAADNHQHELDD